MSTEEFGRILQRHWPGWAAERLTPNHCIAATGVVCVLARRYGVVVSPVATVTLAANAQAVGLLRRGIPADEWPDGPWSVGAGGGSNAGLCEYRVRYNLDNMDKGYPAHLVAVGDDGTLIDLSAGQMSRPRKGIEVAPCYILAGDGEFWRERLPRRGIVEWAVMTHYPSFRDAPDWRQRHIYADRFLAESDVASDLTRLGDSCGSTSNT